MTITSEPAAAPDSVPFDRQDQLEQIQAGLVAGENLLAVYDAHGIGTGFLGLTDRRVIIQDKSFVGEKLAVTSVPYSRIHSVSVLSNKSFAGSFFSSGTIGIHVGTLTYEVEFRGSEKAQHVHNEILNRIVGD
ncbi:hypothetical protein GCM10023322_34710 [Rugosimonospora acidiphila]|uniref:YokE-like PH domain-containing protein n=1 Tax=Rugosimonospora acidiphila TaxID=556531 RepID=A0ABP9RUK4_9ACTN